MIKICSVIAIVGLVVGLAASHPVVVGLGKAVFGVLFIVAFLTKMFEFLGSERPETTFDHGGTSKGGSHGHH